ncbi:MAG: hypothetical protein CM15mP4_1790 [Candidatus Neomarinimicrobiota bacterium]|nr:MAG: hypothetical protein CM15mP4_1790 [Candidatus Neomarinimicrobiota bacterium]
MKLRLKFKGFLKEIKFDLVVYNFFPLEILIILSINATMISIIIIIKMLDPNTALSFFLIIEAYTTSTNYS